MAKSAHEQKFAALCDRLYPNIKLEREVSGIVPGRNFRFDFSHRESKVAVEINGGTWGAKSGHSSGSGIERDYIKNNLAIANGWVVFNLSATMITEDWVEVIFDTIDLRMGEGKCDY